MSNQTHTSRNFAFLREVKGNSSRIHPNDDENDATSLHSIEQNVSIRPVR
jgi:hypothetical protein